MNPDGSFLILKTKKTRTYSLWLWLVVIGFISKRCRFCLLLFCFFNEFPVMINYSWLFVTRDQSRFTASGIGGPPYSNRVSSPISKPTKMSADIPKNSSHSVFQGIALVWKPADRKGKVLARPPLSPRMLVSVNWGRGAVSSPSACWLLWWFNFFLLCDVSKEQQASKANFKHKNKHRQHQLNSNEDLMEFVNLRKRDVYFRTGIHPQRKPYFHFGGRWGQKSRELRESFPTGC